MHTTLKEIAELVKGELVGPADLVITGISGIKEAGCGDITFLANDKYAALLEATQASAVITSRDVRSSTKPIIRTDNPSLAFASLIQQALPQAAHHPAGIHPTAVMGKGVKLGAGVAIGAYAVIEDNVRIGDNSIVYAHAYLGRDTTVGSDVLIYAGVSIRERVSVGNRVVIHCGSVIGSDGFGFVQITGAYQRIPQVGTVVIEDDVEIGANVTIDRARFDRTVIGRGTKVDNLVQIAHNVRVGEHSIIVAQAGISGSTTIGNNVTIAGQVGIVGHISVGDGATIAAQSGISKSVPPGTVMFGYPAKPQAVARKVNACVQNLPRLFETVAELRKKVETLEQESRKR